MIEKVHIYTDGACSGNPGPGGYGIVMEWVGKPYQKEFSEGYIRTTNNRMELLAVIVALEHLKQENLEVSIFSDSKYVTEAVNQDYISQWKRRRFSNVKNPDLWRRFIKLYDQYQPKLIWIKGHNQHPQNERCDRLAVAASQKKHRLIDEGFEQKNRDLFRQ